MAGHVVRGQGWGVVDRGMDGALARWVRLADLWMRIVWDNERTMGKRSREATNERFNRCIRIRIHIFGQHNMQNNDGGYGQDNHQNRIIQHIWTVTLHTIDSHKR